MSDTNIQKLISAGIANAEQELYWLEDYAASQEQLAVWIEERIQGKPLAYIIGHADFYGLNLIVNQNVLIPRFETESLIDLILNHIPNDKTLNILDLGCGSGAIALALKKHRPKCNVYAIDFSMPALSVAIQNQTKYPEHTVRWIQSNWLHGIDLNHIDLIVSNPPYVESNWQHNSISHEPNTALYSGKDGLDDIKKIIQQTKDYKHLDIWFEHGHRHDLTKLIGSSWNIEKFNDLSGSPRFTHLSNKINHV